MEKVETVYSANTIEEIQEITAILDENTIAYKIITNENIHPIFGVNLTNSMEKILYKYTLEVGADDVERAQELIKEHFGDEKEVAPSIAINEEYDDFAQKQQPVEMYADSPMGKPLKILVGVLIAVYVSAQTFAIVKVSSFVHSYTQMMNQTETSDETSNDNWWDSDNDTSQEYNDSDDSDSSDDYSTDEYEDGYADGGYEDSGDEDSYSDNENANDEESSGNEETTSDDNYYDY